MDKELQTLKDFGYTVGDIVTLQGIGLNSGGIIFRIVGDSQPIKDAVLKDVQASYGYGPRQQRHYYTKKAWVDKKGRQIPKIRLTGCVVLKPVFSFMQFKASKKLVAYKDIYRRMKKCDLIALGRTFAEFHMFLQEETKRLSGVVAAA